MCRKYSTLVYKKQVFENGFINTQTLKITIYLQKQAFLCFESIIFMLSITWQ